MANGGRLRTIDAGMDEAVVARVDARLADIERDWDLGKALKLLLKVFNLELATCGRNLR